MAKELLVGSDFTEQMKSAGRELLKKLNKNRTCVDFAAWIYFSDEHRWMLVLGSPLVDSEGPRAFYKRIIDANKEYNFHESFISSDDILVVNPSSVLYKLFKNIHEVWTGNYEGKRITRNTFRGRFVDDVYIYNTPRR